MAVGAGSIARAVRAQAQEEAEKKKQAEKAAEKVEKTEKVEKKTDAKESGSIHQEKFIAVSHIQCELPVYLL